MSLRNRLFVLVTLAVAPPLALVAYNTAEWRDFLEERAGDEALASARLVSGELDQLIQGSRNLMLSLARHPAAPDNEEQCAAYFTSVIRDIPIYREAALVDREGKFHCSTIAIPPNLNVKDRVYFAEPLRTGNLTIGTLTVGRVTRERSIHVSMPYKSPDGRFDGIAVVILNPEEVAKELSQRQWPDAHRLSVLDRDGALVLTVPATKEVEARAVGKEVFERAQRETRYKFVLHRPDGPDEIVGFVPLGEDPQGLFVAVAIDYSLALAQVWDIAARSFIYALIVVLLVLLGTSIAARRLLQRPILALVETARKREAGDREARFPRSRSSSEIGQLSAALAGMSDRVDGLLEQKEFLLRELQHRVMNSLQILSSLLMMQAKHAGDEQTRTQLRRARDRVLSMGTVYQHLYRTATAGPMDFGEFMRAICHEAERAYGGISRATITCEAEPLFVTGSQATSLAVLVHELITNALKHAYAADEAGPILVRLRRAEDGFIELRVADQGRGIPADMNLEEPESLGLKVVQSTARQFGGTVAINRLDPGTEFIIRFPPSLEATEEQRAAS